MMSNWAVREHTTEWAIGDTVTVDHDPTHCRVTSINIRDRGQQFEVSWMVDGQWRTAWVEGWRMREVEAAQPAGFVL